MRGRRRYRARSRSRFGRAGDILFALCVIGVLAVAVDRLQRLNTRSLSGAVTVNDGDTLTLSGVRIRLLGLDAPEFQQTCSRRGVTYSCGREARNVLRGLIGAGEVKCEGHEHDRYDRLLARCSVNGKDLGEALVAGGWAVAYGDYGAAEAEARRARRGIWDGEFDAPRDWRASHGGDPETVESGLLERILSFAKRLLGRPE
ncbi:thermonuclease family protein [Nitratireductor sp. ZSWI3]|uniref:thermonuclease family protein n=1 Tax=Nitratireductor sp. ZSWI3 TaxID=2966359 RepID=UPI00214FC4A6|nr:thermonuclease family protein [Nitratireductor sp. ZSWI3]MCR4266708.1 thermonuclease family protein [Nitratireductor sp. ZSWI3]